MKEIVLYFDFLSPYSYLAYRHLTEHLLPQWSSQTNGKITLTLKPVSLPKLIHASGNTPPGSVPAKRAYLIKDLHRLAEYYLLRPFKMPNTFPFDTRPLLYKLAELSGDQVDRFVESNWRRIFQDGDIDFSSKFDSSSGGGAGKERVEANTAEALKKGAFGVPFWIVIDEDKQETCYFGSDRFCLMERHLNVLPKSKL